MRTSRVDRFVYYPEDERCLFELAPEVRHFEVAVAELDRAATRG